MAYKQRQEDDIGRLTRNGMSEKEAREEVVSVVEGVHDITLVPKLLCLQGYGGPASPMDRIFTHEDVRHENQIYRKSRGQSELDEQVPASLHGQNQLQYE